MKAIALCLGIFALAVCQVALPASAAIDKNLFMQILSEQSGSIDGLFNASVYQFFTLPQKQADGLMQSDQSLAYGLKALSSLMTTIECTKYAIQAKAIDATRDIFFHGKAEMLGGGLILDDDLGRILIKRVSARASMDGFEATAEKMKLLALYIEEFVLRNENGPRDLARVMFTMSLESGNQINELSEQVNGDLSAYGQAHHCEPQEVLVELDKLIDSAMDCRECSTKFKYDPELGAYPMFSDWAQVQTLIDQYVDPNLIVAVQKSNDEIASHVPKFDQETIDSITDSDIEDLSSEILGNSSDDYDSFESMAD